MPRATLGPLLLGLLLSVPGTARAAEDAGVRATLEGRFGWESFTTDDGFRLAPPSTQEYWLEFHEDGHLEYQSDCNKGTGKWTQKGPVLSLSLVATTHLACPKGSLDGRFVQLMQGTSVAVVDGRTLSLRLAGAAGTVRMGRVSVALALTRAAWTLVAVDVKSTSTPIEAEAYRLEFRPGGVLRWKSPCEEGAGSWSLNTPRLTIHAGAFGAPTCTPPAGSPEFARLLNQTARFRLEAATLWLEGTPSELRFRPAAQPLP